MAAELVGGALLSAFLQVAFDRLASPEIMDFFQERRLDETLLKKLNIMLFSINTVIDDAEQKQITNTNVKAWLDELKDAVYEAEDVLDEVEYEVSKRKLEAEYQTTTTSKVWNFFGASVISFHKEIESRMKQVLEKLEYLESRKVMLGLKEDDGGVVASLRKLPTTSLVDDQAGIYGRDDDKEIIVKWLLSENDNSSHLSILSIVGMGGLGKSTLAQLVYNDQRVKDDFNLRAWVCVSDDFDVTRVTTAIVEAITMSTNDTKDLNMLQIKLKEMLTGKRFLLVLDDVWYYNYMQWEALQRPLNYGAFGSKIVITTRDDKVAKGIRSSKIHSLNYLTEEDSWLLFRRYAFNNGDAPHLNFDFKEIGRKIMNKCKGLPLALKAIGSLLYTKSSSKEWNDILKSQIWDEETNILPALRFSYHYLPSLLKRCFAYCSLFPKGYEFNKEHLVQLWMAENFLQRTQQQSKDIKELGDRLFHDLLSRSFFQQSSGDETCFVMHDLINDLAKSISGTFYFRLEADEEQNLSEKTRHSSYLKNSFEISKRFEVLFKVNKLRTFLPLSMHHKGGRDCSISRKMISDLLSKFRCLRVLSLSGYANIVELPNSIGNFKHLRYLDLSRTRIRELPNSICLLYNLQTLKLSYCVCLEKLPSNLCKLINLRHLDFRETQVREMPKQLEKLTNLEVLSSFYVGKCNETNIKQLGDLNLGGTLSILELQNVVHPRDCLAANLREKTCLEELTLEWSDMTQDKSWNERGVLEKLQPHPNLKKLSIGNYGGAIFPNWFVDNILSNIVSLELTNCKYCALPSLGLLPSLKSLSISGFDGITVIGPELHGNSSCITPFGSLEILRFKYMRGWKEWKCENASGAFPHLREFYIENCPKLKEHIPAQLPSLTKLVIVWCEQLVASVPQAPAIHELDLTYCGKVKLECLPSTLKVVRISGRLPECFSIEQIENTISNSCLEELYISGCAELELPLRNCHNFLQKMEISYSCDSLRSFPLDLFPNLQSLELYGCSNLERISVSKGRHHSLTSLASLEILRCPKFVSFPKGGFLAPKLEICFLAQLKSLKSLPELMHIIFPSLKSLYILDCPQVEPLPEDCSWPPNLEFLRIFKCPKLMASRMQWNLQSHSSLQRLYIEDADVECLPEAGLLPSTLISLSFWKCSNLRRLNYNGLCQLSALKELRLDDCPKLQFLPKEGLPVSLSTLKIESCPLLKKRCKKEKGKDWRKIAHIPCVIIDRDIVT